MESTAEAVRPSWTSWIGEYGPLLLPGLLLLPYLTSFLYPGSGAIYSDLAISHYPNAIFLKRTLLQDHQLPLWSPTILSGYPFAADPLSGLWYPPGWLALLLPLPLGFNLVVALHLIWGALGMYHFLRRSGLGSYAAQFGALSFAAMPKLFAHYGAGHLTLLYALPWTPWLLMATLPMQGQLPDSSHPRWQARLFQPGVLLALIFVADPRWAIYAGGLWLVFAARQHKRMTWIAGQLLVAALLAAPLALPLLEYTRLSTRAHLDSTDVLTYSLPPARLLGLLFPDFGGSHEWVVYFGQAGLGLVLLALVWPALRRQARFWLGLALVAFLLALGDGIPGMNLLARLPGLDLLRVPPRALFLTGFALAVAGAMSVQAVLKVVPVEIAQRANLLLTAWAALSLALTAGVWGFTGSIPVNFLWGGVAALLVAIWIGLRLRGHLKPGIWAVGLLLVCVVDLLGVDRTQFQPRDPGSVLHENSQVAQFLESQTGNLRSYSPSYSLPQQIAAVSGLDLADGVDPLQLQSYVSYMQTASGIPMQNYSVTLPPFANGDPSSDNRGYLPDAERLGLLGVGYVVAEYDLDVPGLVERARFGATRVYANLQARPRAWLQEATAAPGVVSQPVSVTVWTPNRIELQVPVGQSDRLLVLAEINYPGWQVQVDGRAAPVVTVAGLLRGVRLGSDEYRVDFVFRPVSVYAGSSLALIGLIGLLVTVWATNRKDHP